MGGGERVSVAVCEGAGGKMGIGLVSPGIAQYSIHYGVCILTLYAVVDDMQGLIQHVTLIPSPLFTAQEGLRAWVSIFMTTSGIISKNLTDSK